MTSEFKYVSYTIYHVMGMSGIFSFQRPLSITDINGASFFKVSMKTDDVD